MPLTQREIEQKLTDERLDELLQLWWNEQGAEKRRDLDLIASAIPFPEERALRVLDLCSGPGDVGRAIHARYPKSRIDCIDRDVFLISMCAVKNRREGVPGEILVRDLENPEWHDRLESGYDVVATANALHWLDARSLDRVLHDVHRLLGDRGVFLLVEPARSDDPFSSGFETWKSRQPPRYSREHWERFWSRANAILGYDHTQLLGAPDADRIGDRMTVAGWIRSLEKAGFTSIDTLLRDADEVMLGAVKG